MKCKNKRKKVNLEMLKTPAFKNDGKKFVHTYAYFLRAYFWLDPKKKMIHTNLTSFVEVLKTNCLGYTVYYSWQMYTMYDEFVEHMMNNFIFFFSVFHLEMPWRFLFFYFFIFFVSSSLFFLFSLYFFFELLKQILDYFKR